MEERGGRKGFESRERREEGGRRKTEKREEGAGKNHGSIWKAGGWGGHGTPRGAVYQTKCDTSQRKYKGFLYVLNFTMCC